MLPLDCELAFVLLLSEAFETARAGDPVYGHALLLRGSLEVLKAHQRQDPWAHTLSEHYEEALRRFRAEFPECAYLASEMYREPEAALGPSAEVTEIPLAEFRTLAATRASADALAAEGDRLAGWRCLQKARERVRANPAGAPWLAALLTHWTEACSGYRERWKLPSPE